MNKLQIARIDPATGELDWTTTQEFSLSDKGVTEVSEHWFKSEPLHTGPITASFKLEASPEALLGLRRLIQEDSSPYKLFRLIKKYKAVLGAWPDLRMGRDEYKKIQADAHKVFGCNLKRFLRAHGCKADIYYNSNGHWFKMK